MSKRFLAVLMLVGAGLVCGQSDAPLPRWEVVSIKPCAPAERGAAAPLGPGRIAFACATVDILIHQSYLLFAKGGLDLSRMQTPVEKGPASINSDRYALEAKAEVAPGQVPPGLGTMTVPMLRSLLADRFKLKIDWESKQVPVYALTVDKAGSKFKATPQRGCAVTDPDHPPAGSAPATGIPLCGMLPRNDGSGFHGVTMALVCDTLSRRTDRKVIDKTGLEGMFDIPLDWSSSDLESLSNPVDATDAVRFALQKFGLRLEPALGPSDNLIVDRVERPSEN